MESTFDMIPFLADSAGLMQKKQADALLERNGETAAHGLRVAERCAQHEQNGVQRRNEE